MKRKIQNKIKITKKREKKFKTKNKIVDYYDQVEIVELIISHIFNNILTYDLILYYHKYICHRVATHYFPRFLRL